MANTHHTSAHDTDDSLARNIARAVAAVFLLVGVLGFIPGITTNYDSMQFAGHESEAKLLGIFQVSVLHNIVHLLFGVVGFAMSKNARSAAYYLLGGGLVYAILWLYGVVIDHNSDANFVPLNTADNWLHFLLAVGMIGLGAYLLKRLKDRHHGPADTTGTGTR